MFQNEKDRVVQLVVGSWRSLFAKCVSDWNDSLNHIDRGSGLTTYIVLMKFVLTGWFQRAKLQPAVFINYFHFDNYGYFGEI